jgi:predicted Zn-dependent protease
VADKVTGEKRFALLPWSNEQERRFGEEAAPNFEQQLGGSYPDPQAQAYLEQLVLEMAGHSVRRDDFEWRFEILDSSEPNAFALPGGFVYVTRGLLQDLRSEGEFVAVLGHELGHVEHQHAMFQQNRSLAAGLVVALFGVSENLLQKDPDKPDYVTALAGTAASLRLLSYSREQESEADLRGLHFAHAMGHDPRGMKRTFEYFERIERESGSAVPAFLRTHPRNEQRIADIDRAIRSSYPEVLAKAPGEFRAPPGPGDRFTHMVDSLERKAPAYEKHDRALALLVEAGGDREKLAQAQRLAEEALRAEPEEPLFHGLAGEIEYAQQRGDRGRARFEKARALQHRLAPAREYWKPVFYLGVLDLEAGKPSPAAASLRRAAQLFPDNALAHYWLGRAEERNRNPKAAAAAYARVTELAPPESSLHEKSAGRLRALRGSAASSRDLSPSRSTSSTCGRCRRDRDRCGRACSPAA